MNDLRVGILEDDHDMRPWLAEVVGEADGLELAWTAECLADAFSAVESAPAPDLCLVDLQLPDGHGTSFIRSLRSGARRTKALVLTSLADRRSVVGAFEAGASGYLLKDTPADRIRDDIRAVAGGGTPISSQAATHLIGMLGLAKPEAPEAESSGLTPREREMLTLFAKGMSYRETAELMEVSTHTVQTHVKSVYRKLAVHSKSEAVFEALQNGWLDI